MDQSKQKAARERLRRALPALSIAAAEAKVEAPDGRALLALGYKNPDGSGRITASFDYDPFIADLLALLGYESWSAFLDDARQDG